ncbi:MAG: DUF6263 family protein [Candidatus Cloacimonadota bacterium]|nr:DUF6263 family protein [Candidatus Cloacimonadota bacterium]
MYKRNLVIASIILLVLVGCAQKVSLQKTGPVMLTQELKVGDTQKYHIEQIISNTVTVKGQTQTQQINMEMEIENSVVKIVADSVFINVILTEIAGSINAGGSFTQIPGLDEIKGETIAAVLLPDGSAEIVEESEVAKDTQLRLDSFIETLYGFMPNKEVKSGETWNIERSDDESSTKSIYTFRGMKLGKDKINTLTISVESEFSINSQVEKSGMDIKSILSGTSSSTIQCSTENGFVVSQKSHAAMEGSTEISGSLQGDMELPTFMNIDVTIKRLK